MINLNINFEKADRISNGISEIKTECEDILSSSKSISASAFGSYSPSTVSNNSSIQASISEVSNLVSKQCTFFISSIELYREAYEEEKKRIEEELKAASTPEFKGTVGLSFNDSVTILGSVSGGKMIKIKFEGREYYIPNTKISCIDYQKYVEKYRITQNGGLLPNDCLLLSQYYAVDMMRGSFTKKSAMARTEGSPATRIRNTVSSSVRSPILKYVYDEMLAGRPTALQVTQVNSYKGDRHWVTVVGFSTNVKSYKDLNADNLLVLDCVDGKLQVLSKSRSSGGHERDLFAQGGTYLVRGATNDFLNKEVYSSRY
jgi:hypothetical protein